MKKLIDIGFAALLAAGMVGCKSVPDIDTMYSCASAVGVASGLVANECNIEGESRQAVIDIMNIVIDVVPATNETFQAAWKPVAQKYVDQLIADGKIDANQGTLILVGVNAAAIGIDYVFYRYPTAKEYKELTSAAVEGFVGGFLMVFKPDDERGNCCVKNALIYDTTALKHVKSKVGK